jgi:hypothetical protein
MRDHAVCSGRRFRCRTVRSGKRRAGAPPPRNNDLAQCCCEQLMARESSDREPSDREPISYARAARLAEYVVRDIAQQIEGLYTPLETRT